MIDLVCRSCYDAGREAELLVRAKEDGTLVYLATAPAKALFPTVTP